MQYGLKIWNIIEHKHQYHSTSSQNIWHVKLT